MIGNRISLITLGVRDLERSVAYYRAVGFEPETVLEKAAFFDLGGAKFGLYLRDDLAHEQGRAPEECGVGSSSLAQNQLSEAEVDAAVNRALAAGAALLKAPEKMFWGGYSGYVADPDGHAWEYSFNPFWPLDSDGRIA